MLGLASARPNLPRALLFRLDSRALDDRAVALDAVADERRELLRAAIDNGEAVILERWQHVGRVQGLADLAIEARQNRCGQSRRAEEAEPRGWLAEGRHDFGH